jgi:glucosamine--fructose-6-phosphate aminotransferase (isomerizing)
MCGIFGYIGPSNAGQVCINGLKCLEYRGYDSAGLAGILDGKIHCCKAVGKLQVLEEEWKQVEIDFSLAIGHTRWATHGPASLKNAHPHLSSCGAVAVVHNGIIENYRSLKQRLAQQGILLASDTDSEVIAQLIQSFYVDDLLEAVQQTLALLHGFWGLAVIHQNHPNLLIAASQGNPIAIAHAQSDDSQGTRIHEAFVSSDANAFDHPGITGVHFLSNGEVASLQQGSVEIFDQLGKRAIRLPEKIHFEKELSPKNGYEHYMLKEIFEQPATIRQALNQRIFLENGFVEFENFSFTDEELRNVERIMILGCGTSWHAGCLGALMCEELVKIPANAKVASEFRYQDPIILANTLVLAISQSGETADTIAAVREAKAKGAKVLSLCNVRNSTLVRESHGTLLLRAGPEISVCSTKAFTSQLTVLALFSLRMARLRHMEKEEGQRLLLELSAIPDKVSEVLRQQKEIRQLAHKYAFYDHFFFLGRHYMFITSLEGALKLKEISYLHAVGYPAGEMKHGPIALINPQLATIALLGNQRTYAKSIGNLAEIKARHGPILALAPQGSPNLQEIADDVFYLPPVLDLFAAIPYSVVCQLFAYYIATFRGTEIDRPRNLAKSVTVE